MGISGHYTFSELLRQFRVREGMSQLQLAKGLGVHRNTIGAWERGDYLPEDRSMVSDLIDFLHLSYEEAEEFQKASFVVVPAKQQGATPDFVGVRPIVKEIPFARNPFFTGREQELAFLRARLQESGPPTALHIQAMSGMGGIGKTQLAIEYAYRYKSKYQRVFWVRAESIEALNSSYAELAELLNLVGKETREQEVLVQAVKVWLSTHQRWLLILDNADEPALLHPFLPEGGRGHVLVTTRAADLTGWGVGIAHSLEVRAFSAEQGALFLLQRANLLAPHSTLNMSALPDHAFAFQIAQELGGLPLALDQAGAYIAATRSSLAMYRSLYQGHRDRLLAKSRNPEYPASFATTWNLSFAGIEAKNLAAAELLYVCAFLAPDAIPEVMLTQGAAYLGPRLGPVLTDPFRLNEAIGVIRNYSLLTRDPSTQMLSMHRLVQVVLRDRMDAETRKEWCKRAIQVVNHSCPGIEEAEMIARDTWEQWLTHALVCATWIDQEQINSQEGTRLLNAAGVYLVYRARTGEAERLLIQALSMREQLLGPEHLDTAESLNALVALYIAQGKYEQAEVPCARAVAIRTRQLGPEHALTAESLHNLACVYNSQGRYEQAEPLYLRAIALREQALGSQHPLTAQSLNDLATLYDNQGKYEQAESLYVHALAIWGQKLGPDHPLTAQCLHNLAHAYEQQKKFEQAEELQQRALDIRERQLGPDHPLTVSSSNNLALFYGKQGRYEEAEPLFTRVLVFREQRLGPDHPDTATSLNNLARLYQMRGRYEQAEPLYVRALEIREERLGPDHPRTAQSLHNLAELYHAQGKYEQAEPLYVRALAIRKRSLGMNHPDTVSSRNKLAQLYRIQGKEERADLFI